MSLLICAARDCVETFPFDPLNPGKKFHSEGCAVRTRMRLYRERKRQRGGDPGGGGRQRRLFPNAALAKPKPPKRTRVAEPTLFEGALAPRKAVAREQRTPRRIAAKAV
jgi:hypothetical protein